MLNPLPPSGLDGVISLELTVTQAPLLQRFFEENPAYFLATQGAPAAPGEAVEEIIGELPAGMPFTRKLVVGYADTDGSLVAMSNVISDLLAPSIYHVGTFIVATRRHGSGDAQRIYRSLEGWAQRCGAAWMRLGVVLGNTRAERFWRSQGYLPVRERPGIEMGSRVVTVRNMVKPLTTQGLEAYFALAPRDQPDEMAPHDSNPCGG
jgi:ribosomal protein S18 acetylase RimI-like enzyme